MLGRIGSKDGKVWLLVEIVDVEAVFGDIPARDEVLVRLEQPSGCDGLKELWEDVLFGEVEGVGSPERGRQVKFWLVVLSNVTSMSIIQDVVSYIENIPPGLGSGGAARCASLLRSGEGPT
jgi:hypothetical protein